MAEMRQIASLTAFLPPVSPFAAGKIVANSLIFFDVWLWENNTLERRFFYLWLLFLGAAPKATEAVYSHFMSFDITNVIIPNRLQSYLFYNFFVNSHATQ
jgi:hypothetical protein